MLLSHFSNFGPSAVNSHEWLRAEDKARILAWSNHSRNGGGQGDIDGDEVLTEGEKQAEQVPDNTGLPPCSFLFVV